MFESQKQKTQLFKHSCVVSRSAWTIGVALDESDDISRALKGHDRVLSSDQTRAGLV